jgi:hypothetical protein
MRRWFIFLLAAGAAAPIAAADVAVSVSVGEPGFYGRIDIGSLPHPELIFPQPVIIKPVVGVVHAPVYLRVPPGHAKDWSKHCSHYHACGERVFFVQDHWYNEVFVPQYKAKHGKGEHSNGKSKDSHKDKGKD